MWRSLNGSEELCGAGLRVKDSPGLNTIFFYGASYFSQNNEPWCAFLFEDLKNTYSKEEYDYESMYPLIAELSTCEIFHCSFPLISNQTSYGSGAS